MHCRTIQIDKTKMSEMVSKCALFNCCIDWSEDARMIVAAKRDGLGFWDPETLQLTAAAPALNQAMQLCHYHDISFSPCSHLVAASQGRNIAISDVRCAVDPPVFCSTQHGSRKVCWFPDGNVLLFLNERGRELCFWDIRMQRVVPRESCINHPSCEDFAISPDGLQLVSGGDNNALCMWDVSSRTQTFQHDFEHSVFRAAWSPDGSTVSAGLANGDIFSIDAKTRTASNVAVCKHDDGIRFLAWAPKAQDLFATGSYRDDSVHVFKRDGRERCCVSHRAVNDIAWSPKGTHVAGCVSEWHDNKIVIWDICGM